MAECSGEAGHHEWPCARSSAKAAASSRGKAGQDAASAGAKGRKIQAVRSEAVTRKMCPCGRACSKDGGRVGALRAHCCGRSVSRQGSRAIGSRQAGGCCGKAAVGDAAGCSRR